MLFLAECEREPTRNGGVFLLRRFCGRSCRGQKICCVEKVEPDGKHFGVVPIGFRKGREKAEKPGGGGECNETKRTQPLKEAKNPEKIGNQGKKHCDLEAKKKKRKA